MKQLIVKLRSLNLPTILVGVVSGLLGIFVGPMLETAVQPWTSTANLPLTIFILVAVVFATQVVIWENTHRQISATRKYAELIAQAVGQQVRVLSYENGLEALIERGKSAKDEVLIYTNLAFDWEKGIPLHDENVVMNPMRKKLYQFIQSRLLEEYRAGSRGSTKARLIRIIRVPKGHSLPEVFPHDPMLIGEARILGQIAKTEPEFASIRTCDIHFHNTFAIFDKTFLYIDFDLHDFTKEKLQKPFAILVEDPNSIVIKQLLQMHERLQAESVVYHWDDSHDVKQPLP